MNSEVKPEDNQSIILSMLADGEIHSGQELADRLGVSRTAIWKHLQKLEQWGVDLDSIKGRGYRIRGGIELLDRQHIHQLLDLDTRAMVSSLEVLDRTTSTNDHILSILPRVGSGCVCLAEQQTAGRGRRGRGWVSPFGKNIYLSIGWEFEGGAAVLEGLSLATGVAIVRAFQAAGIHGVGLKWPNDIFWENKKLAGVLLEMSGDASGKCQLVIGVGINVDMSTRAAQEITQQWTDLQQLMSAAPGEKRPGNVPRNRLAALLINELFSALQNYPGQRFSHYREAWEALNIFAGKPVVLQAGAESVGGLMQGVTESGALRLLVSGEEKIFYGGEVSLRGGCDTGH